MCQGQGNPSSQLHKWAVLSETPQKLKQPSTEWQPKSGCVQVSLPDCGKLISILHIDAFQSCKVFGRALYKLPRLRARLGPFRFCGSWHADSQPISQESFAVTLYLFSAPKQVLRGMRIWL
jgi:hypothetical protein